MHSYKELLCVLVCLGILFLTGAAHVQKSSAAYRQRVCADNLKRIQRAAVAYQNDHDGAFQPVIVRTKPRWTYWHSFIITYVEDPKIFYCPAHPRAQKALEPDLGAEDLLPPIFDPGSLTYGMNYALSSSGDDHENSPPANINAIADPGYTIYFGDCKMPTPSLRPTKWCWKDDYAPVHNDKANFVFIDGHVEIMNQENLGLIHAFDGWKKDVKRWSNWK